MADELTEAEYETAKLELQSAITAYFDRVEPGTYVGAWILVTHKDSIELTAANASCVGVLGQTGQSFVTTRGLIEIARDGERVTEPMRVCSVSGCPNIYDSSNTRCPTHAGQADKARGTATQRGYNSAGHQAFRRAVLHRDPVCAACGQRQSTIADHWPLSRKQLIDQGRNPNDPAHGRGLCVTCHNQETARNQPGGWHN